MGVYVCKSGWNEWELKGEGQRLKRAIAVYHVGHLVQELLTKKSCDNVRFSRLFIFVFAEMAPLPRKTIVKDPNSSLQSSHCSSGVRVQQTWNFMSVHFFNWPACCMSWWTVNHHLCKRKLSNSPGNSPITCKYWVSANMHRSCQCSIVLYTMYTVPLLKMCHLFPYWRWQQRATQGSCSTWSAVFCFLFFCPRFI